MQRDMDLVREILKELAESQQPLNAEFFTTDTRSKQFVGYHFKLLQEAGLITAKFLNADNDPYYSAQALELTWAGHDYYDAISSDTVWSKAKRVIGKTIGSASLDTFQQVAVKIGTDLVLSNLPIE